MTCRLCGSAAVEDLGALADGDLFAGRVIRPSLPGGRLWRCGECESLFRNPTRAAGQYMELYARGADTHWHSSAKREDFRVVIDQLSEARGVRRVLDVGCGTGDFLDALGPCYQRFGIEPSAAADIAARRGTTIVGASLAGLAAGTCFDAITLIDVIEHVMDVGALLDQAYAHLVPGGLLIISTGNPGCTAWRRLGSRFWYSSFPEHLTFPSLAYFRTWADRHGAGPVRHFPIRYRSLGVVQRALCGVMQVAYLASPAAFDAVGRAVGWLLRRPQPRQRHFSPGVPGLFTDHHVLVLRRPI